MSDTASWWALKQAEGYDNSFRCNWGCSMKTERRWKNKCRSRRKIRKFWSSFRALTQKNFQESRKNRSSQQQVWNCKLKFKNGCKFWLDTYALSWIVYPTVQKFPCTWHAVTNLLNKIRHRLQITDRSDSRKSRWQRYSRIISYVIRDFCFIIILRHRSEHFYRLWWIILSLNVSFSFSPFF